MSERQIKEYYERIEKLLNGANKETYGFAPQEIKNILRSYEELQQENKQLKDNWNKIEQIIENERMSHWAPSPLFLTELLSKMQELEGSET